MGKRTRRRARLSGRGGYSKHGHHSNALKHDDLGIGPATIKSKSEPVQPSKWFGDLYNVVPGSLFPREHAHFFPEVAVGSRPACLREPCWRKRRSPVTLHGSKPAPVGAATSHPGGTPA